MPECVIHLSTYRGIYRWECQIHKTTGLPGVEVCEGKSNKPKPVDPETREADLNDLDQRIENIANSIAIIFDGGHLPHGLFHRLIEQVTLIKNAAGWVRRGIERETNDDKRRASVGAGRLNSRADAWDQGYRAALAVREKDIPIANPYRGGNA